MIDSAPTAGLRHIVHVGASSNDTAEVAHWGWHRMIQAYIAASGLGYTFLQPEAFMQNITAFGWLQGDRLTNLIGDVVWSWVDARDVGLLAAEALRRPDDFAGQTWRLGYERTSMKEVAQLVSRRTSRTIDVAPLDPLTFYDTAIAAGGDPAYLSCVRDQFQLNAAGKIADADATFDPRAFEIATGRKPRTWPEFLNVHIPISEDA